MNNILMNFFISVITISFNMSITIALALLCRKFVCKKFSATGRYLIWILIVIRLAIPFTVDTGIALLEFNTGGLFSDTSPTYSVEIMGHPYVTQSPMNSVQVTQSISADEAISQADTLLDELPSDASDSFMIREALAKILSVASVIWLIGVTVNILWNIVGYRLFTTNISRKKYLVRDKRTLVIYYHMCNKLNIKHRIPELYVCDDISSPMIYGIAFRRKRIVIPTDISNSAVITSILRHELIHHKRGDLWVKLTLLIANSLHWFNPMIGLVAKYLELDMELSCDERVLNGCNKKVRGTYGRIMIDIAQRCGSSSPAILTTHFNPKFNDLKTRCHNILDTDDKTNATGIIILFAVLCMFSGILLNCTQIKSYANTEINYEDFAAPSDTLDLTGCNIIISNKTNSIVNTSNSFDLNSFLRFIERFSSAIYGDINASSEIDLADPRILDYIIDETYLRESGADDIAECLGDSYQLECSQINQTIKDIFNIEMEGNDESIFYTGKMLNAPAMLMNILNVNANEYGEVVVHMMLYDISAAESGMSSDTYIGDGTYYFQFHDDAEYGQIYTFRFCFGEREYHQMRKNYPMLVQSDDDNIQIMNSDKTLIVTPAYYKDDSKSLTVFNKLVCIGHTIAIAGKESKSPDEPFYVHITHDNGESWTKTEIDYTPTTTMTEYPVTNIVFNFIDENNGSLILGTSRAEIFVYTTSDGGMTWQKQRNFALKNYSCEALYAGGFITKEIGFICLIPIFNSPNNPNVYMTRDGGVTWNQMDIDPPNDSKYDEMWSAYAGTPTYIDGQIRIPVIVHMREVLYYVSDNFGGTWYWDLNDDHADTIILNEHIMLCPKKEEKRER